MKVYVGSKQNTLDLGSAIASVIRICVYLGDGIAGIVPREGKEDLLRSRLNQLHVREAKNSIEADTRG
jgi:hypothetical protein